MKKYLWLICLLNLSIYSQNSPSSSYDRTYAFVYSHVFEDSLDSTYINTNIDSLFNFVSNSDLDNISKNKFLYVLYRASIIISGYTNQSLEIGKTLLENIDDVELQPILKYFKSYYQRDARKFNVWIRFSNIFYGIKDDYEAGIRTIIDLNEIDSDFEPFLLLDKVNICINDKKDVEKGLLEYNRLLGLITSDFHKKRLANLNYRYGFYENYIVLIQGDKPFSDAEKMKLLNSYVKIADFKSANKVLKSLNLDESNDELNILSAHIYFFDLNEDINLDLFEDLTLFYGYSPLNVFDKNTEYQYIYLAELLSNRMEPNAFERFLKENSESLNNFPNENLYLNSVLFWEKKDYFNAKRSLHNLVNNKDELRIEIHHNSLLLLAHIAFLSNDIENLENYLSQIDKDYLKPEWLYIYNNLLIQL